MDLMASLLDGATLRRDQGRQADSGGEYAPKFWDSCDDRAGAVAAVKALRLTLENLELNHVWFCFKQLRTTSTGTTYWIMLQKLRTAPGRADEPESAAA